MTTITAEPTLYATPEPDWLATYGPDVYESPTCVNCGETLCCNFEGRKGLWGHNRTEDTVCRPPVVGQRVRILTDVTTRAPGDDTGTPADVKADQLGTVEGFMPEWYDTDVRLDDGRNVWISPDNLTPQG